MDNIFQLDETARQLYGQLAGIDDTDHARPEDSKQSGIMELFSQEEKKLDFYRLLLAQATCLFAGILSNSLFSSLDNENDQKIKVFLNTLERISKCPGFDGKIYCRLRGQQCPSAEGGSETYDYELSFGKFLLDYQMAQSVEAREPVKGKALYSQLVEAFKSLSLMNIFNFSIDIGSGDEEQYRKIEKNIVSLVRYHRKDAAASAFIVKDEYDRPNINLTLLASANNVRPEALQNLVGKIKQMMLGPNPSAELSRFTTAYDVILASKRYRQQLKKMPLEVNSVQWLTQNLHTSPKKNIEAVKVSRLVLSKYGNNPKMASEVLSSINREGYTNIRTEVVGKRLSHATNFIQLTEETVDQEPLQKEALQNIEDGLEQLADEIYESITIKEAGGVTTVSTVSEEGSKTEWSLHEKISGLLSFFKQRSTTKQKVRDIASKKVQFNAEDYSVIARNFHITELEASHLLDLLKACFDDNGRFRRNFFEKNIPEFIKYDTKVFEFLWHYLKELSNRADRVAFLNSLQILVARLKKPEDALKILLSDIFKPNAPINFSDRNGLMLGNILLRKYNREEGSNIELTPEEVVMARVGLNQEMTKVAADFSERNQDHILNKVKKITETLFKASAKAEYRAGEMQPRFMLYLLRELLIFFALVGGEAAESIIHGLVQEFGDPYSAYYKSMASKEELRHSLQLLQVAGRALRRLGAPQADTILTEIARKEPAYTRLYEEQPTHAAYVKRLMDRLKNAD